MSVANFRRPQAFCRGFNFAAIVIVALFSFATALHARNDTIPCQPDEHSICVRNIHQDLTRFATVKRDRLKQERRLCLNGDAEACFFTGISLRDAIGDDSNTEDAIRFLDMACTSGLSFACEEYRETLWDVPEHQKQAADLWFQACEQGDQTACRNTGRAMWDGFGGTLHDAYVVFERLCEQGDPIACDHQGTMILVSPDLPKNLGSALELFKKSCQAEFWSGCFSLAVTHIYELGPLKDSELIKQLLGETCKRGHADACGIWGLQIFEDNGDVIDDQVWALFKRGCDLGSERSCGFLEAVTSE